MTKKVELELRLLELEQHAKKKLTQLSENGDKMRGFAAVVPLSSSASPQDHEISLSDLRELGALVDLGAWLYDEICEIYNEIDKIKKNLASLT